MCDIPQIPPKDNVLGQESAVLLLVGRVKRSLMRLYVVRSGPLNSPNVYVIRIKEKKHALI